MPKTFLFQLFLAAMAIPACAAQPPANPIRLNQAGFYPEAPKIAVIAAETEGEFSLFTPDLKEKVFTGKITGPQTSSISGKKTWIADFSEFQKTGGYVLLVPGLEPSYPFEVKPAVHKEVAVAALKAFYYQRMSTELPERYAGKWRRPFSHPDTNVLIHPSAASDERPAGTAISSPGGWYDAGD